MNAQREDLAELLDDIKSGRENAPEHVGRACRLIGRGVLGDAINRLVLPSYPELSLLGAFVGTPYVHIVRCLIDAGADLKTDAPAGLECFNPPLHEAALQGQLGMVELLLERGANVNATNEPGCTALLMAATAGHADVVRMLLAAGADPTIETVNGESAFLATFYGRNPDPDVLNLLRVELRKWPEKPPAGPALVCKRRKRMYSVTDDGGLSDFAKPFVESNLTWGLMVVATGVIQAGAAWAAVHGSGRVIQNVHKAPVRGREVVFVMRLKKSRWSIVLEYLGVKRFDPNALRRRAAAVSDMEGKDVVAVIGMTADLIRGGRQEESHDWSIETWVEEQIRKGAAADFSVDSPEAVKKEKLLFAEMDAWFAAHGILVPPCELGPDSLQAQLIVRGLRKSDMQRVDAVLVG